VLPPRKSKELPKEGDEQTSLESKRLSELESWVAPRRQVSGDVLFSPSPPPLHLKQLNVASTLQQQNNELTQCIQIVQQQQQLLLNKRAYLQQQMQQTRNGSSSMLQRNMPQAQARVLETATAIGHINLQLRCGVTTKGQIAL